MNLRRHNCLWVSKCLARYISDGEIISCNSSQPVYKPAPMTHRCHKNEATAIKCKTLDFRWATKGERSLSWVYSERFSYTVCQRSACINQTPLKRDEDAPCWTDGGQLGGVDKKLDSINTFNIRFVFKLTSMPPSAKAQHKPEEPRLTYWT